MCSSDLNSLVYVAKHVKVPNGEVAIKFSSRLLDPLEKHNNEIIREGRIRNEYGREGLSMRCAGHYLVPPAFLFGQFASVAEFDLGNGTYGKRAVALAMKAYTSDCSGLMREIGEQCKKNQSVTEKLRNVFVGMVEPILYLHASYIAHGDVKENNYAIEYRGSDQFNIVLLDLGGAVEKEYEYDVGAQMLKATQKAKQAQSLAQKSKQKSGPKGQMKKPGDVGVRKKIFKDRRGQVSALTHNQLKGFMLGAKKANIRMKITCAGTPGYRASPGPLNQHTFF